MDHALENLGPERFQHLCQALLAKEFPGIICLPVAQPDGGRDAIRYAADDSDRKFAAFQIKYSRNPGQGEDARKWVLDTVDGEVEKVKRLIERGATQYWLATNVQGTAHLDVGSIDKLQNELSEKFGLPVLCWWRDDINRRLDGSWDIKLRYPEVLSGQDFFRLLLETAAGQEHERRLRALRAFLADQYAEDLEVKFKQVELQNKLDLFVDLPFRLTMRAEAGKISLLLGEAPFTLRAHGGDTRDTFVIEDVGDDRVDTGTAGLLLSEFGGEQLRQIVIEGAPGQGKSTLAQYLCQVHRIKLLRKTDDLAKLMPQHQLAAIRIPFKVDLRELATWLAGTDPFAAVDEPSKVPEPRSVETFMARLVRQHSGGVEFDVNDVLEISRLAPLLLLLDGLDEVADIKRRADVVSAVSKAIPRIRENCPELRVVITSRPAAFANSPGFDREQFPHLQLGSVRRAQIQLYANRWMDVRNLAMKERAEFQSILDEKLNEPHLRDLARNPMQLTILLSLIHTQGAALPDKRTSLYDEYVRLFFSREAAKNHAVRQHIELLKDIHRYLAWILHSTAETGRGRTGGRISSKELKFLLERYLRQEKHSTAVVDEVFGAMLERVVMIVPRVLGTYEFEVQPLREYFAARYLYDTASYSPPGKEKTGTKPDRFDAIARNFYWLNVVRFFCGCFTKGELLDLADRVKELISDTALGQSRHPVILSAMLLADWVFTQSPKAVAQVAGVLSTRDSLRRLLPENLGFRGEQMTHIPARCGGSELLSKVFEFLEDPHTLKDLGERLAAFVQVNGAPPEIDAHWLSSAHGILSSDPEKWLWIGSEIGSLSRVDRLAITAVVGNGPLSRPALKLLCKTRRFDCVLTSDKNAEEMVSYFLSAPPYFGASTQAPLYLVPLFFLVFRHLRPNPYMLGSFFEAIKGFDAEIRLAAQPEFAFPFDFPRQAFSLSCKLADLATGDSFNFNSALTWEALIEECRQMWGESPTIIATASAICVLRRGTRSKLKAVNLSDRNRPLCDRIRVAKSQSKNVDWWKGQLGQARDAEGRFLFHLSFWVWAPLNVVFEMAEPVAESLDILPFNEWSLLLDFIFPAFEEGYYHSRTRGNLGQPLPRQLRSQRLALLVGLKDKATYGQAAFLDYLMHSDKSDPVLSQFRQGQAFEAAIAGVVDWRIALSIIRSTYIEGAVDGLRHLTFHRPPTLPETVSQQVLAHAKDYPVDLWEVAVAAASVNARKAVRAVGRVAKKDRWFA